MPYVLIVAVAVSLDSFVVGFSVSLNKRNSLLLPVAVASVTCAMCVVACWVGMLLKPFLQNANIFCGAILLGLACYNVVQDQQFFLQDTSPWQCLATGASVGADGAAAALSLALKGGNVVALPLLFALTHFVAVAAGQRLAKSLPRKLKYLSALMLFALGTAKLFL